MTRTADTGRRTLRGTKRLTLKKETVKDLPAGPKKAKDLGDDQLAVAGGLNAKLPQKVTGNLAAAIRQSLMKGCETSLPGCVQTLNHC